MFDVAPTELLLVAVVALVVIGPKDLPRAMRFVGKWVGRARGVARQFRSGLDTMIRESELAEMEQQWAEENARIMREHPSPSLPAPEADQVQGQTGQALHGAPAAEPFHGMEVYDPQPVMVEQPELKLEPAAARAAAPDKPVAEAPSAAAHSSAASDPEPRP